jgi:cob(I)alamin adenosyltransferase
MVKLDTIYTRGGDKGETSLGDGSRVAKHHPRIAVTGDVDEANAMIGAARLHAVGALDATLSRVQNELFDLGADLCVPEGRAGSAPLRITAAQVARLENDIDTANGPLPPLSSFVLPAGTALAVALHAARTVVRRAERHVAALAADEAVNPLALAYLNRLSDLLFVLARQANIVAGQGDVLWKPGQSRG